MADQWAPLASVFFLVLLVLCPDSDGDASQSRFLRDLPLHGSQAKPPLYEGEEPDAHLFPISEPLLVLVFACARLLDLAELGVQPPQPRLWFLQLSMTCCRAPRIGEEAAEPCFKVMSPILSFSLFRSLLLSHRRRTWRHRK